LRPLSRTTGKRNCVSQHSYSWKAPSLSPLILRRPALPYFPSFVPFLSECPPGCSALMMCSPLASDPPFGASFPPKAVVGHGNPEFPFVTSFKQNSCLFRYTGIFVLPPPPDFKLSFSFVPSSCNPFSIPVTRAALVVCQIRHLSAPLFQFPASLFHQSQPLSLAPVFVSLALLKHVHASDSDFSVPPLTNCDEWFCCRRVHEYSSLKLRLRLLLYPVYCVDRF